MVDINWAFPFSVIGSNFSIEGHIEYIVERTNEFDSTVESWILAQPQFRYDVGADLFGAKDRLFLGAVLGNEIGG